MIADREKLIETDEVIEAAFAELGYCPSADALDYFTADEMDKIRAARTNWTDAGHTEDDTADLLVIERAQATRGQRRQTLAVVRFGEFCAVYQA